MSQPNGSSSQQSSAAREAEFFDRYVEDHEDFNPFADRAWRNLRTRFHQHAGDRLNDLLDVGCGTGQSRQIYRDVVTRYTGVDLSSVAVRRAETLYPDDTWRVADATALPFEDQSFDAVTFSSVLHHIPDYQPAVREAARVLRPGGLVFAFDPNAMHPAMALLRLPRSPFYSPKGVSPNERPLLGSSLRNAFAEAGLTELWQSGQADLPYRRTQVPWVNALLGVYNAGDWLLQKSGMGRWFGAFLVTVGRKPMSSTF